jgi:putative hydrolase of the HAD superfamily/hydrolase
MINWVRNLKLAGEYKIGMLSNINRDWMDTSFPFFESEKLFDELVLSGDVNIIKPDPEIFKLAADRLGVEPNECIMIDDVADNIDGAKLAGMYGIVHTSITQSQSEFDHLIETINA